MRRRIVSILMLVGNVGNVGNVGIVTAVSSLRLSFIQMSEDTGSLYIELGTLVGGLVALWLFASSRWVDRWLCSLITWALARYSNIDTHDFTQLLHLKEDYSVNETEVEEDSWLAGRTLRDARLRDEGLIVLGVECGGGSFIGAPPPDTEIRAGDRLLVSGRGQRVAELDRRRGGSVGATAHVEAAHEQEEITQEELERAKRSPAAAGDA